MPPPLRPTTPVRSPAVTPSETWSSTTVVAYALPTASRLTNGAPGPLTTPRGRGPRSRTVDHLALGISWRSPRARRAPGRTRPGPSGTPRRRPARRRAAPRPPGTGPGRRRSGRSRRRPPPSAPRSSADPQRAAQLRAQRQRRRLQVVGQQPAERGRVVRAQRVDQPVRLARGRRLADRPRSRSSSAYTRGVDSPSPAIAKTQCQRPVASTGVSRSPRPVPSAVPPVSEKATSLPSSAASSSRSSAVHPGAPQRVAGDQRGGRVGAAAGHPAGHRDALDHVEPDRRLHAGALGQQHRRPPDQVAPRPAAARRRPRRGCRGSGPGPGWR